MTDRAMSDDSKPCVIWECIYDHGNGKFMGEASKAQRERAFAELRRLHAEVEALRAEVERLRLMQPVIIGPTGQSNMLTAGEIDAIDAASKEST